MLYPYMHLGARVPNPADDPDVGVPRPASPTTIDSLLRSVARVQSQPVIAASLVLGDTYELMERLGGGGMGVVYRAHDRRLGREVAVKILRTGDRDAAPHLLRLFEREARATAQLLHPNIVTLHQVGEHDGAPYLVLELLSGETLAARLARKGRLSVGEALAILDGVLTALAFAHERGVLHRDLKPNNVFITGDERIKVLDFGVAVSLDTDPGPVTRSAGTPGYMAPEQRSGAAQDARTDVWAAAVLLIECLTGHRPDCGDTLDGRSPAASVESRSSAAIPRAVRVVIERALSADPVVRPGSAGALRADLAHAAATLAPERHTRPWRWLALVVAAGVTCGAAAWQVRGDRPAPPPANVVSAAEVTGMWNGVFGTMYLQVAPDGTVRGAYQHDDGVVVGRYVDGVIHAWWCERPSRVAPDDAGAVEMRFGRDGRRLRLDGRWKYGDQASAPWHDDWDATSVEVASDPKVEDELARRIADASCPDHGGS
jgi:hypothetical protein